MLYRYMLMEKKNEKVTYVDQAIYSNNFIYCEENFPSGNLCERDFTLC